MVEPEKEHAAHATHRRQRGVIQRSRTYAAAALTDTQYSDLTNGLQTGQGCDGSP